MAAILGGVLEGEKGVRGEENWGNPTGILV